MRDDKREVRPASQLGLVVDGAEVAPARAPDEDQYHTPPPLARRLVSLVPGSARVTGLPLTGRVVLDLGGGGGALTDAALLGGAARVVVVERDARWCGVLRERYRDRGPGHRGGGRVLIVEADVDELAALGEAAACARLGLTGPVDVVLSNPPFRGAGVARFGLAAIALAKRDAPCAFIMRTTDLATVQSLSLWTEAEITDLATCSRRPAFGCEAGDTARADFSAVRFVGQPMGTIDAPAVHAGVRLHFWPEAWS